MKLWPYFIGADLAVLELISVVIIETHEWWIILSVQQWSGQIIIFHQPRFPWNKGNSLSKPPFGVKTRVRSRWNLTRMMLSLPFSSCMLQWRTGKVTFVSRSGCNCLTGWCSTLTLLLICSSFSRENGHPLLIYSSLSTSQIIFNMFFLVKKTKKAIEKKCQLIL